MSLFVDDYENLKYQPTNDDWYTPPEVFETMGVNFDLDVCAPFGGVPWIPAKKYYTLIDDCLSVEWVGNVWMNPPFSNPGPFVDKWINHGHGICLVPCAKSSWFVRLWGAADAVVIPDNLISKFIVGTKRSSINYLICLCSIGSEENALAISNLGSIRRKP
jgi:hypothetical protein